MDLKKKLKSFVKEIRESAAKSPTEEEVLPAQLFVSPAVAKFKEHISRLQNDPEADREAIEQIEAPYYEDPSFDVSQYELEKLSEASKSLPEIDADRARLARQLEAVSRKVSELVLENHPAYAQELERVMEMERSLTTASVICAKGRRQLSLAKKGFTTASLGLLHNYRKRQQLIALLKSLRTIKTLQRTDIRLREMLDEEDYPGAIQLCLECQKAASTFRHYKCISELSSKLQDTLEMIEESLDVALSKTCGTFDHLHYGKVQTAYRLLGKVQTSMDQLHMHFTSAIHNTAFTIVLGYVELASGTGDNSFQKRQYTDLCKHITVEMFTPCLIDLCKALWEVMKSYHKTMKWHEEHDAEPDTLGATASQGEDVEESFNRRYIRQKLEHGLVRIYGDVQQKVKVYMLSTDISYFKYDEFIQVLDIVNRLMQIGEEFCGSKSEALQDSIRKQSLRYFRNYHRTRMDELRMFLENEGWELCPVKNSFSITQLQEFKYMKGLAERQRGQDGETETDDQAKAEDGQNKVRHNYDYFARYGAVGSPFDAQITEEQEEDLMETNGFSDDSGLPRTLSQESDSDEDVPDELKQDYIDENTGDLPPVPVRKLSVLRTKRRSGTISVIKASPIITNTTLNVCRLFGKYMQMMNVLKPIAFDVIICMSQLFDYYLYAIYGFFASELDMNQVNESSLSSKLRTTLKRIQDNLILDASEGSPVVSPGGGEEKHDKIGHPHLSPIVNLGGLDKLFGLTERVVATESLVFLAEQFEFLQPQLKGMIPPAKKAFLQQFYAQTVSTAQELRKPVYRTVAARAIDYDKLLALMANVKWDIKDIMSQHSHYVDVLLQEFEAFNLRLSNIGRRVPIPKVVSNVLWEHCIRLANRTFVEGYASAKKCTNEGRALMQLDFQQFLVKLEKLTDLRPIPDREYVEAYIKAYYLPETQLDIWIRDHKEYSSKQLTALVNCISHINRKGRQKLLGLIEELEKTRR